MFYTDKLNKEIILYRFYSLEHLLKLSGSHTFESVLKFHSRVLIITYAFTVKLSSIQKALNIHTFFFFHCRFTLLSSYLATNYRLLIHLCLSLFIYSFLQQLISPLLLFHFLLFLSLSLSFFVIAPMARRMKH
jgi:hypothetical protein